MWCKTRIEYDVLRGYQLSVSSVLTIFSGDGAVLRTVLLLRSTVQCSYYYSTSSSVLVLLVLYSRSYCTVVYSICSCTTSEVFPVHFLKLQYEV